MAKVAADFEKIINTDRSRKKNEALAAKIFGKDRRASVPAKASTAAVGGKIAARAGVKKRVVSTSVATSRPGSIDFEWTHDLHDGGDARRQQKSGRGAIVGTVVVDTSSLSNRISRPGEPQKTMKKGRAAGAGAATTTAAATQPASTRARQQRRTAQVANALVRAEQQSQHAATNIGGLSIRGMAAAVNEPLVVMAQNFAPGTTAADIESVMTPVGGLVTSCRILKTTPLVIAEIVFEAREGAERVIEAFNNQTADGRVLHVYPKAINGASGILTPQSSNLGGTTVMPRALARGKSTSSGGQVVDGSLGFDDPMDTDGFGAGRLYSDDLVGSRQSYGHGAGRRGRGRGGRW